MDLSKLSVEKLVRQLRVFGCLVDKGEKLSKKELLSAIDLATKDRLVKEVVIDDESLQSLVKLFTDVKFKVGETVLVLVPQELEQPPKEVGAAPEKLYFGIHRKPVRKIEDVIINGALHKKIYLENSTTVCAEEDIDKLIFNNLE